MINEYITDYLTGEQVPKTPEEPNRQEMLRILHEDYGYPKELMLKEFGVKKNHQIQKEMRLLILLFLNLKRIFKRKNLKFLLKLKSQIIL